MTDVAAALELLGKLSQRPDKLAEAETAVGRFIDDLSPLELAESAQQVRAFITRWFLPKRAQRLHLRLEQALAGAGPSTPSSSTPRVPGSRAATSSQGVDGFQALSLFGTTFHAELINLADSRIFQWPLYENLANRLHSSMVPNALASGAAERELYATLRNELAHHISEVTRRGFLYATGHKQLSNERALEKANSGLVRFLEVAVNEYRVRLGRARLPSSARTLRSATSSWLCGVLVGRARADLGGVPGARHVADNWRLWIPYVPFLCSGDLETVIGELPHGDVAHRLSTIGRPLTSALDDLAAASIPERVCILLSSTFDSAYHRLELTLVPPIQLAEQEVRFHCYLSEDRVDVHELESAALRDMRLILAPLSDQARREVRRSPLLSPVAIDTGESDTSDRLQYHLAIALAHIAAVPAHDIPVRHNYARRFPVDQPDLGAEFRVRRRTVEALLDKYETDNGVRLWCSVRRSGKTTSCVDLQTHRGQAVVIAESCAKTGAASLDDSFYQAINRALSAKVPVDGKFVETAIRRCAPYELGRSRIVFVLDEYESLFAILELAASDRTARYNVVQPLLNQLVQFATTHLVIFLGLRPDAYFIIPDQNQLSPYVRADRFPLFEFRLGDPDCEFRQLVLRILTERVPCDDAFLGHLFAETAGHPVLTVNVLTILFDWLDRKSVV